MTVPTIASQHSQQQQQQLHHRSGDDDDDWLFSCRCESAKSVATLLTCLRGSSSSSSSSSSSLQPVTVFVSPSSITFHVFGTARQSQASVDLQAGLFSHYQLHTHTPTPTRTHTRTHSPTATTTATTTATNRDTDESAHEPTPHTITATATTTTTDTATTTTTTTDTETQPLQDWQAGGEFSVNLTTVLDCLHILGTQSLDKTKLSLSYNLHTEVFQLELLEDGGVLATAAIPGMAPPTATGESLALAFRSAPITSRVIVTSDWLRDAMQELELVPGATTCIIAIASHGLELLVLGTLGACVITIPGQCCVSLECGMAPTTTTGGGDGQARSYPMSSVIRAMQGLDYAHETCISINDNGMIAIQHQILDNVGQGSPNFVDFIMSCLIPEDDDGDGDGDGDISTTTSGRGTQEYTTSSFRSTNSQIMEPYHRYSSAVHNPSDDDNDNYDDEQDDDDNDLPTISSVPLFGTVFNETNHRPSTSRNVRRRVRRRHDDDSSKEKTKDTTDANDNDDDDGSRALLEQDDCDPVLDVTARATPLRRGSRHQDDYDGSSSPELVYR